MLEMFFDNLAVSVQKSANTALYGRSAAEADFFSSSAAGMNACSTP